MATVIKSQKVKADCKTIGEVWAANADFKIKDVTLQNYTTDAAALAATLDSIASLELQLTFLRNTRDDLSRKLNEINTRVRSGMKSYFGPNSSQYEQVGGTRSSERKKGGPKAKKEEPK